MNVVEAPWGMSGQAAVSNYAISNNRGASIVLTNFGAAMVQMNMPAPSGEVADVILGFDRVSDYETTNTYFGATVGRFGNRIRRGKFTLDGTPYQATLNEGANSLHGGVRGYDKQVWDAKTDPERGAVIFSLTSPDGDEGFPGQLKTTSTYSLDENNVVRVEIKATTDKPTLCNMVHHSYFNLAGHGSGNVLDQELQINADFYTPVDEELIITGEVLKVAGTPFDFREYRRIGHAIAEVPNAGAGRLPGGSFAGYDHNWCLRGEPGRLRQAVCARDPDSKRGFEMWTTEPGVHFYTGGYLNDSVVGKGGLPYQPFAGFTLETQTFPDSPNLSHVPQARLDPGREYHHLMEFRFFT